MSLPDGFSEFEFLQDTIKRVQNQIVHKEFSDLGDENWNPDITTGRGALRHACTLKDSDSADMLQMRLQLFYIILRKAQDLHPAIYGIPVTTFHESVEFFPQIRLFFLEDWEQVEEGYSPVEAEISFRLMHETSATMTHAKAEVFANKIRNLFASGQGFVWKKGREKWVYKDLSKGYDFRLLAWSESEAKKVIEQVLDIQGHSPDWNLLGVAVKKKTYTTVPGTHRVYGKQRRKPRERPIAYVRFRYAELKLWGLFNDITLVDRTGFRHNPLIRV
ncbi:hypothetical protein BZZ01_32865 (plasmid) [Nostocales cyanobacterium HT-58-2]|nr:hypothetical protein BZZ01_32865 [Nostocales cyanobacterium HT-58-2]